MNNLHAEEGNDEIDSTDDIDNDINNDDDEDEYNFLAGT